MRHTVVLCYPRIFFEANYPCSWIPYSVLAIASSLKNNKQLDIILFDENRRSIDEFETLIKEYDNILCIGYSIMTGGGQISNALEMAETAKKIRPNVLNIFGGPHVNVLPVDTLNNPHVDISLVGPGQKSFGILVDCLLSGVELKNVPGVYYYNNSELVIGPSNVLDTTTMVPYDFEFINCNDYIQYDSTIDSRTINYISSQGCVYRCKFCYETNYCRKYARLSSDTVISDLKYFVNKYKVNGVKFYDADWFINSRVYNPIIDALTDLQLSWAASIHPLDILRSMKKREPLLEKLSQSKCRRLLMGIESGSNRVLKEIVDKGITKEEIFTVVKEIAKYGILGSYTFIVGFPNETIAEQEETFDFIKKLWQLFPCPETRVHIYTPYPGTALYNQTIELGFVPPDSLAGWSSFDYYKSNTPWTDESLEERVRQFTLQIPKNGGRANERKL